MLKQELEQLWAEGTAPVRYARLCADGRTFWTRWQGPGEVAELVRAPWLGEEEAGPVAGATLEKGAFLAPCEPTKVVGLAHNYKSLVGEMESYPPPLIFLKGRNALAGYGQEIVIPREENRTWQEVELAMVVGERCKGVSEAEALDAVFGFTLANDVSTTNLAGRDHHLAQSKSLDGFCPCGPFLVPGVETASLRISSSIDGQRKQDGSCADRLLTDAQAIAYASQFLTLEPGDLVITGTCDGWKETTLTNGCEMEVAVESLGILRNRAVTAK